MSYFLPTEHHQMVAGLMAYYGMGREDEIQLWAVLLAKANWNSFYDEFSSRHEIDGFSSFEINPDVPLAWVTLLSLAETYTLVQSLSVQCSDAKDWAKKGGIVISAAQMMLNELEDRIVCAAAAEGTDLTPDSYVDGFWSFSDKAIQILKNRADAFELKRIT
jgi:hypothetical protein